MAENKQDRPEDTTSQAMVLMGRLLALEGEIAGLKSDAGFVSGDVCAQLAGWIPGGGGGGMTYDYLYSGAKRVIPPEKTTNFLKIMLDGSGASWVAAMPETLDSDSVVIDVRKNRIYIHGAFGEGV